MPRGEETNRCFWRVSSSCGGSRVCKVLMPMNFHCWFSGSAGVFSHVPPRFTLNAPIRPVVPRFRPVLRQKHRLHSRIRGLWRSGTVAHAGPDGGRVDGEFGDPAGLRLPKHRTGSADEAPPAGPLAIHSLNRAALGDSLCRCTTHLRSSILRMSVGPPDTDIRQKYAPVPTRLPSTLVPSQWKR